MDLPDTSKKASSRDTHEVIGLAPRGMIWSLLNSDSFHRHGFSRIWTIFSSPDLSRGFLALGNG
jgi:hypothetical protein